MDTDASPSNKGFRFDLPTIWIVASTLCVIFAARRGSFGLAFQALAGIAFFLLSFIFAVYLLGFALYGLFSLYEIIVRRIQWLLGIWLESRSDYDADR